MEGIEHGVRGVVPSDVSDSLADEGLEWSAPTLSDFTDQQFADLSEEERRRIAGHFAWAEQMPPESFGQLKLPHHRPEDGAVVLSGVIAAMGALLGARGGVDIPDEDRQAVYDHLAAHYRQFNREPPEFRSGRVTQTRAMDLTVELSNEQRAALGPDDRIPIAISSETPAERLDLRTGEIVMEVLDHSEGAVDLSRARHGLPLLVEHDVREQIGIVENIRVDADRVLRGDARFSRSQRAQEIRRDILDGIRKGISLGFRYDTDKVERSRPVGARVAALRIKRWAPFEVSIVAVPADPTVGVGRAAEMAMPGAAAEGIWAVSPSGRSVAANRGAAERRQESPGQTAAPEAKENTMSDQNQDTAARNGAATVADAAQAERARARAITELCVMHGMESRAAEWIEEGIGADEVARRILDERYRNAQPVRVAASQVTRGGDDPEPSAGIGLRGNPYPERFTGRAPEMILVRRFREGDRALADQVVGLISALAAGDRVQARRYSARALGEVSGPSGGFLVPEEFATDIIGKVGQLTPLANREFVMPFPMTRDVMRVPVLATRPTVARYPENSSGAPATTEPAFGEVVLTAQPFGALVPLGEDFLADTSIAVVEYLRDLFAEVLAEQRNALFLNGSGTNEPQGVRTAAGVPTVAADTTDGGTKYDSLVNIFNRIKPRYQVGAIWLTSQKGLSVLMKIKDANGLPILQRANDEPFNRLFGRPLFVTEAIPENLGAGSDETEIIFGNFRYYAVGDRMAIEVDTDRGGKFFENRQVALRVIERYDGRVGQAEAFVRGTGWK